MFDQIKNLKGLMGLMGRADELREKYEQMQERLAGRTVEAESGAGAVRAVVNGKMEVVSIELDRAMIQTLTQTDEERTPEQAELDRKMIEELIRSAVNEGMLRARNLFQEEIQSVTGDMNLPGLEGLLGGGR